MAAVTNDPKFTLTGSDGAYGFTLTDPDGNDLLESSETYESLDDVNVAMRLVEDSIRLALPLPAPLA